MEEYDGGLYAYEFKYSDKAKARLSITFSNAYPDSEFKVITPKNIEDFVL
ncbi:MAG: hypothetical protein J6P44_05595 [Bacteroidales bacterium]|nr:hypothetical protein [Bacteroidales bacterium]